MSQSLPSEFRYFIGARLFFVLGIRMITTIVLYQVFHLASTYMVGFAGLAEFIPAVIAALYAGHYIDRHNKKNILIWAYIFYFACAALLGFISLQNIQLGTNHKITAILSIVFCTGIIRSFAGPSANSMIAAIVPKANLQKAVSLNSSTWLISSIIGHATGGLLIAAVGISTAYFIAAALIAIAVIFAGGLSAKPPVSIAIQTPLLLSIKQGFSYLYQNKNLLGVMSLDLLAVLFGGAVAFIPEIAEKVLHTDATGYGFLNAAMDIGSLMGMGVLMLFPLKRKQGMKMLLAVAGFGFFIIIFAFSKLYLLSFAALLMAGLFDAVSVVVRGTIMQMNTPDELRGRVASINLIFINSSNELGQFESGLTSKMMGTIPAIWFGGGMSILVVLATWFKFPGLRKLEY